MAVASPTRPRASSSRLFIIVGIVLAALAFIIMLVLGQGRGPAVGAGGPTVKIVVAARDIPFRTPLAKEDLQLQDWPVSLKPTGAFTSIDDILGKGASTSSSSTNANGYVSEVQIRQGQPVTNNLLARSLDAVQVQPAYLPIPRGFEAVTVPTSEQVGVAFFIQPGDYINVIATTQLSIFNANTGQQQGPPKTVTKTVYTNVHVLKVGPATNQVTSGGSAPQASSATASSLTLVMTECDAEMLRWLQSNMTLTYTLPSYQDYKPSDAQPDPACLEATSGHGVGPQGIDSRWHFTTQN